MCVRDRFSREAMGRETMALYKKHGTNPFSSCLPILIQMPIFFSLFSVLRNASGAVGSGGNGKGLPGIGMMNQELTDSCNQATIFGAPLKMTFMDGWNSGNWVVAVSYTHLDVYKRQDFPQHHSQGERPVVSRDFPYGNRPHKRLGSR